MEIPKKSLSSGSVGKASTFRFGVSVLRRSAHRGLAIASLSYSTRLAGRATRPFHSFQYEIRHL